VPRFDEHSAECHVLTYREGLLATAGHDLKLRFGHFSIETSDDGNRIQASFDVRSLRVVNAVKGNVEQRTALSVDDKKTIDDAIANEVLRASEHPTATFRSIEVSHIDAGVHVDGELVLLGVRKRVGFLVRRLGDFLHAEIALYQPDFGIKPFSALMGTLRVKPNVTVRAMLSAR
jgi:polyisoprenoid-binding protein YceI